MKYSFEEKKRRIYIIAICLLVVIAGIIYISRNKDSDRIVKKISDSVSDSEISTELDNGVGQDAETGKDVSTEPERDSTVAVVHVCGAVNTPGVYELGAYARISDAISAAGGFSDNADADYLNLAEPVYDGQKITVLTKKQVRRIQSLQDSDAATADISEPDNDNGHVSDNRLVNINTAGVDELMTLPGIGKSKAESIISYREENGNYADKEDIMNITGIKDGVYSKISDYITVK